MPNGAVQGRPGRLLVLACATAFLGFAPRAGHAQGQCPTEFQQQTSGLVADASSLCATAADKTCTFELALCVNQAADSCTPKDLKKKRIHAKGHCAGIGKLNVKANATSAVCGGFAGVKVRTKKQGSQPGTCRIHAKAGDSRTDITLNCQPSSNPCPTPTTTTTTQTPTTTTEAVTTTTETATTTTEAATTTTEAVTTTTEAVTTTTEAGTTTTEAGTTTTEAGTTTTEAGTTTTEAATTTTEAVTTTTEAATTTTELVTTTTEVSTTTTTLQTCCGLSPQPSQLSFTTGVGSGNCGTLTTSTGTLLENLACGGLYTGGGSSGVPLPFTVPDMGSSLTGVSSCSGTSLTLANLTSTQTGSDRNCTSVGCLFGPPLPIPNTATTPISLCVINTVSADATGTADCGSGASSLSLPLNSELFLTGDLFPNAPGIQSCPVCNPTCNAGSNSGGPCNSDADCPGAGAGSCAGTIKCHGGANDGLGCTPADSALNPSFPTTHDCPPPANLDIGGLPIGFALSTGTRTVTGQTLTGPVTNQQRVYCGFCRDIDGDGTLCFEGAPETQASCPHNSSCISAGSPFICCTGPTAGTCDQAAKPCTDSSQCTDGNGTWPNCQQHNPGAFGFGTARTITENGSPAGDMTDGAGHASTLVSIFCVPPTFSTSVDNTGDLPGPGAVSLPGTAQLLP